MNLKPKDVAQKSGIGKTSKSVNKLLYLLAKKKVLTVTFSNGKDPKWNKDPSAQYSDRDLHDWAAELEYGITSSAPTPVCGMTFCFAMFFLQIGTSLRSYELLQQYIEERESQYSFLDFYESNEYWSWDPDLFLLTVNTTFYAH
ncbi:Hypothetical predicted protein [Mytilus galloprovincialis]|uniref:Uncharacterized protein n=1 Tax=Mytilus galloprovincialis TaxID=29158 RepID=A0A8B6FJ55_MYTGA|nr:Hypothetical predicted protein [Mytilus galloprovincialis]